jgi:hypothetical protein
MKLEDIRVESFPTTGGEVSMMPVGTYMDATAGCCNPPEFSYDDTCTRHRYCV